MLLEILTVILVFIIALGIAIISFLLVVHRRYDHLPGPHRSGFFTGNGIEFKTAKQRDRGIAKLIHHWTEEYGPCYKIFVFHICLIVTTGPAFVKEFLTNSQYRKSKQIYATTRYIFGQRCLGDGLFSEIDHARWQKRRAVIGPAFNKKCLKLFMEQFNDIGDRWMNRLAQVADSKTFFKLYDDFSKLTLDAISEIGFSNQVNAMESNDHSMFTVSARLLLQGVVAVSNDPFIQFKPGEVVFRNAVCDAVKFLRGHGMGLIKERRDYISSGAEPPDDMLSHIIKYKEAVEGTTDEDLMDDFLTLFLAGQDTTSAALSWLFMDLGRNPTVFEKVCREVNEVIGNRREVRFEDLARLDYMSCVIKETLRMHPAAPNTARDVSEEVWVDGYRIPAGSTLLFPFYAIHNSSANFKDPFEYHPDRFLHQDQKDVFTYLPFGAGARSCIGKQFALMEMKVLLGKFVQRFNFELDPNQSFDMVDDSSIRPVSGTIASITHCGL